MCVEANDCIKSYSNIGKRKYDVLRTTISFERFPFPQASKCYQKCNFTVHGCKHWLQMIHVNTCENSNWCLVTFPRLTPFIKEKYIMISDTWYQVTYIHYNHLSMLVASIRWEDKKIITHCKMKRIIQVLLLANMVLYKVVIGCF